MARKRFQALLPVISAIAALAAVLSCAPSGKNVSLSAAAKDKDFLVALSGTQGTNSLNLQIKNNAKAEKSVLIPAGAVLSTSAEDLQPMLVASDTVVVLAPGEGKTVSVPTYSLSALKNVPGSMDGFDAKKYKMNSDPSIKKLLAYLNSEAGKESYPADGPDTSTIVQQAVWLVTDKMGYEENLAYLIDSIMLSTILQVNPAVITLFIEDAESIQDEAAAQEAMFKLMRNKISLHDKLKTVFAEKYDEAVEGIKGEVKEEESAAYRQSINDFLGKSGLKLTY
jgi:hypothetical protein